MKKAELITAVVFIITALIGIGDANRLGFGWEADGPQAGFAVFWLAALLLGCSVGILVINLMKRGKDEEFFVGAEGMWEAIRIFFTSILITLGIIYLGVYLATFGYCLLFSRWLGKHRWPAVVVFSVITTLAVFYGMEKGLHIPLPKSPLYHKGLFLF